MARMGLLYVAILVTCSSTITISVLTERRCGRRGRDVLPEVRAPTCRYQGQGGCGMRMEAYGESDRAMMGVLPVADIFTCGSTLHIFHRSTSPYVGTKGNGV